MCVYNALRYVCIYPPVLEQKKVWQSHMTGRGNLIGWWLEVISTSFVVFYHSMATEGTQRNVGTLDSLPELM